MAARAPSPRQDQRHRVRTRRHHAATAALGCAGINEAVRRDLTVPNPTPEQVLAMLSRAKPDRCGIAASRKSLSRRSLRQVDEHPRTCSARARSLSATPLPPVPDRHAFRRAGDSDRYGHARGEFLSGRPRLSPRDSGRLALRDLPERRRTSFGARSRSPTDQRPGSVSADSVNSDPALPPRSTILASNSLTIASRRPSTAPISTLVRLLPTALATLRRQPSHVFEERPLDAQERGRTLQVRPRAERRACGRSSTSSSRWSTAGCPCCDRGWQ